MPVHAEEIQEQLMKKEAEDAMLPRECCQLYAGSRFSGQQRSGRNSYEVTVDIQVRKIEPE